VAFDFSLSERVRQWQEDIRTFVDSFVIPREQQAFEHGLDDILRRELQTAAKEAGLWAPQANASLGGGGFRFDESAVLLEEAGRSLLGPLALNCAAPDEGNIHLLTVVATQDQREKYLKPLVRGDVRSCFAMTEPAPGAGSDPSALQTIATKVTGGWSINGRKHLITGADGAGFAIIMAAMPTMVEPPCSLWTPTTLGCGSPGMRGPSTQRPSVATAGCPSRTSPCPTTPYSVSPVKGSATPRSASPRPG